MACEPEFVGVAASAGCRNSQRLRAHHHAYSCFHYIAVLPAPCIALDPAWGCEACASHHVVPCEWERSAATATTVFDGTSE